MKSSLTYPHIQLGVEIECERIGVGNAHSLGLRGWSIDGDGSLRDGGTELVFDGPTSGREAELRLSTALRALEKAGAVSNYRTSIHVHCDTASAGLGRKGIVRAVALYGLVERALFNWEGNGRECSNFCVPLFKGSRSLDEFANAIKEPDQARRDNLLRAMEHARYSALNLHALSKFGTLEFRHLLTTFDYERVITWINLCSSILVAANSSRVKMDAFLEWVATAPAGDIAESIFSKELIEELNINEIAMAVELGRPIAVNFLSSTGMVNVPPYVPQGQGEFYNPTIAARNNPLANKLRQKYGIS